MSRLQEERKEACQRALERSCQVREKQTHMYAKLKPIVTSKSASKRSRSPRPAPSTTGSKSADRAANVRNKLIAEETRTSIDAFEATMREKVSVEEGEGEMSGSLSGEESEKLSPRRMVSV